MIQKLIYFNKKQILSLKIAAEMHKDNLKDLGFMARTILPKEDYPGKPR